MRKLPIPQQWRPRRPSPLLPKSRHSQFPKFLFKRPLFRLFLFLVALAFVPFIFLHFRLRSFNQMRLKKCGWLENPPLVCAHGGDSSKAIPNTMDAYKIAIDSNVDCMEIDVSRSSDGVLFALHDRDLQRMTGNNSAKVGFFSQNQIKALDAAFQLNGDFQRQEVPTATEALELISGSVQRVIVDAKVGPPLDEKDLANDILSVVSKTNCTNCLVWTKSDTLARDLLIQSVDVMVGYIVMMDPNTGVRSDLLRIKGADVVGVYHPLIDKTLVRTLHRRGLKVYAWTVDDAESMHRMLSEHIDAIVTSNPSLLQDIMQDVRTECLEEGFP